MLYFHFWLLNFEITYITELVASNLMVTDIDQQLYTWNFLIPHIGAFFYVLVERKQRFFSFENDKLPVTDVFA